MSTDDEQIEIMLKYYPAYEPPSERHIFVKDDYGWLRHVMRNRVNDIEEGK